MFKRVVQLNINLQGLLNAPFGRDHDNPVGPLNAIQGLGGSVFQHADRLHFMGRDVLEKLVRVVIVGEPIDDNEGSTPIGGR